MERNRDKERGQINNPTRFVIAAILQLNKIHGYELARQSGLNQTTIYETLGAFEKAGLVVTSEDTTDPSGRRKIRKLTQEGYDKLQEYFTQIYLPELITLLPLFEEFSKQMQENNTPNANLVSSIFQAYKEKIEQI